MMQVFRSSTLWIVDFLHDGRARRWYRAAPAGQPIADDVARLLHEWYGTRARLVGLREATPQEEAQYLRGEQPRNVYCPTGREPVRR